MLASANARHHQIAYVTNDLDKALELFSRDFGVSRFYPLVTGDEPVPAGGIWMKAALANVNGTEIEIIQPLGDGENLFSTALPKDRGFALVLHHVCIRITGGIENWEVHRASIDETIHPVAMESAYGDFLRILYTDERASLGHYLEHMWMSPFVVDAMAQRVPKFPPEAPA
ncbi:MAG TPA: VOC family protein [Bryobacteraceae bacterium]|jgi:hypothetical protein